MKIIVTALAVLTLLGLPAQAQMRASQASSSFFTLFGEYDHYGDGSSLNGGGGGLGWTFNRYLGMQAGGQYFKASGANLTNLYGEVKLSWPLLDRLSVYASLGGAYGQGSASVTEPTVPPVTISASRSASGYRAGLGAEYWFSRHWGLRAGWHRENVGGVADDIGAGVALRF